MADDLKIPQFSKQKKIKEKPSVVVDVPVVNYVPLTDEQIESCRKGQDIFDFARDIEELVRLNNRI